MPDINDDDDDDDDDEYCHCCFNSLQSFASIYDDPTSSHGFICKSFIYPCPQPLSKFFLACLFVWPPQPSNIFFLPNHRHPFSKHVHTITIYLSVPLLLSSIPNCCLNSML